MMNKPLTRRDSSIIVAVFICLVPIVVIGVLGAMRGMDNSVRQWLPEGFRETQEYDWFLENFGSEEMAVVSWPGCTLSDERLDKLAAGLVPFTVPSGGSLQDDRFLFSQILTPRDALEQLTAPPLALSQRAAIRRLTGTLIGPDGKTCALVVMVSPAGERNRESALETVCRVAESDAGLSRDELRMGGPTVDSVALSQSGSMSRYTLAGLAVVIALLFAWRCLKKPNLVVSVFATALMSAGLSVAVVYFTGGQMNLVMTTMPILIYVLSISAAIHLTNYYRDAVDETGPRNAPLKAVKASLFPCMLTAATTALGLGSLAVSDVIPVKMFGIYSALGVLVSFPVLFLLLPAIWTLWPLKTKPAKQSKHPARQKITRQRWSDRIAAAAARYNVWILAGGLMITLVMGAGIFRLQTSVKLLNFFSPQSKIISDYRWLENNLGPLVPIEIVARIGESDVMTLADRTLLVHNIQKELESIEAVGGTISIATFAPRIPAGGGLRSVARRAEIAERLSQQRERLLATNYLKDSADGELWRVSARVEAINSLDYGEFMATLQERVNPIVEKWQAMYGAHIDVTYTGVVPLVYKAQNELLSDLSNSFLTAFVLIALVMIAMLRSIPAGLIAMLPNIFPAVLIFGLMAWSGNLCDIGSMMTASVALGIAVDDTIHYLTWFKRGVHKGYSNTKAVKSAHRHCAKPMLQTTLICGVGMLAFGFSAFVPTSRFAILMFAMLASALVADLILLPAILSGSLGRFFNRRPPSRPAAKHVDAPTTIFAPVLKPRRVLQIR